MNEPPTQGRPPAPDPSGPGPEATLQEVLAAVRDCADRLGALERSGDVRARLDRVDTGLNGLTLLTNDLKGLLPRLQQVERKLGQLSDKVQSVVSRIVEPPAEKPEAPGAVLARLDGVAAAVDRLQPLTGEVGQLGSALAAVEVQLGAVDEALRRPADAALVPRPALAARLLPWVALVTIALVGAGLLAQSVAALRTFRGAQSEDLSRQAGALAAKLDAAEAELRSFRSTSKDVKSAVDDMRAASVEYQGAEKAVKESLARLSELEKRAGAVADQAKKDAELVEKKLNDKVNDLAAQVSEAVGKAYIQPVQSVQVALDGLSAQVKTMRQRVPRRPARRERAAVVLFASKNLDPETCKPALEKVFCETPLRDGYDGYQLALYLATNGALKADQPLVPYGEDPVPPSAFHDRWVGEAGSVDGLDRFDPKDVLAGVPAGVGRRCVLVVSPAAEAPRPDDKRWPDDVRVSVLTVGAANAGRQAAWSAFCTKHKGAAREAAPQAAAVAAALAELAQPDDPSRP